MRYSAIAVWVCALVLVAGARAEVATRGHETHYLTKMKREAVDIAADEKVVLDHLDKHRLIRDAKIIKRYPWYRWDHGIDSFRAARFDFSETQVKFATVNRRAVTKEIPREITRIIFFYENPKRYLKTDNHVFSWQMMSNFQFDAWFFRWRHRWMADAENPNLKTWIDDTGKTTVVAELLKYDRRARSATLQTQDGKTHQLPRARFSKYDQLWLDSDRNIPNKALPGD